MLPFEWIHFCIFNQAFVKSRFNSACVCMYHGTQGGFITDKVSSALVLQLQADLTMKSLMKKTID